jgi:hypothetical protein
LPGAGSSCRTDRHVGAGPCACPGLVLRASTGAGAPLHSISSQTESTLCGLCVSAVNVVSRSRVATLAPSGLLEYSIVSGEPRVFKAV